MILITCVDQKNGVAFHGRRQTSDAAVFRDIFKAADNDMYGVEVLEYTQPLWDAFVRAEALPSWHPAFEAESGAIFTELNDCEGYELYYPTVILYRWDKVYPADVILKLDLTKYHLVEIYEFQGTSHEKVRRETYERIEP